MDESIHSIKEDTLSCNTLTEDKYTVQVDPTKFDVVDAKDDNDEKKKTNNYNESLKKYDIPVDEEASNIQIPEESFKPDGKVVYNKFSC